MSERVRAAAASANDNPVVETGARLGYAASGVLHLLIGWVGIQLAWFHDGRKADQTGAIQSLADTGLGALPLWVALVGFGLLGLWQLLEALVRRGAGDRLKAAGKGVVYLALAAATASVAMGGGKKSGSKQTADVTRTLMDQPFGRVLVGLLGLAVIGVGVYHVVKGWRRGFLRDLREHPGPWAVRLGRVGYIAKGVALALVGGLFVSAAATAQPGKAKGLDGALRTLLDAPLGPVLLTLVAAGFAAYGLYSFFRARYARV